MDRSQTFNEVTRIKNGTITNNYTLLKIFAGNRDSSTSKQNLLDPVIKTTTLTIMIVTWQGTCSLRMELLGCKHQGKLWELHRACIVKYNKLHHIETASEGYKVWYKIIGFL